MRREPDDCSHCDDAGFSSHRTHHAFGHLRSCNTGGIASDIATSTLKERFAVMPKTGVWPLYHSALLRPTVLLLLLLCLTLLLSGRSGLAQTTFGTITGVAKDRTGSVVPSAAVTLTNEKTGFAYKAKASDSGIYTVPNLLPGTYTLRVEAPGFEPSVTSGINLNANQTANVDAPLAVAGAGSTYVEVMGSQPILNTQTAALSTVLTPEQMEKMPLITRQKGDEGVYGYAFFNTGVSNARCQSCSIIANGARYMDQQPTVDGITVMSSMDSVGGSTVQPGLEGMGEVDVILSNASAEFSQPVQLAMVRKGGSNAFHGGVFYNYNGSRFNAANYFSRSVPFRVYNDFGASLAGPVMSNRLLFFGDYEGSRESTAVIDTVNVPLQQWRTGNFSNIVKPLMNPYTGTPFAGNQIPSGQISSVSQNIQSLYFLDPNFGPPTLQAGNYRALFHPGNNGVTNYNRFDTRLDFRPSDTNSFYGGVSYSRMPISAYVAPVIPPFSFRTSLRVASSGVIAWTHTITSNLLNEARIGFARDNNQIKTPVIGDNILSQVGVTGVPVIGIPTYPVFNVTGITSPNVVPYFGGVTTDFEVTDNLTWVHRNHLIKAGFDLIRDRNSSFYYGGSVYGTYSFTGAFTGSPYADFLLGLPQSTSLTSTSPTPHWVGDWWGAHVEDQWKPTDRLTVNLGLRWEGQEPYSEQKGLIYNFDPAAGSLVIPTKALGSVSKLFPSNIPIQTAESAGYPSTNLVDKHFAEFYPRVGIAYRPFGENTVVRGGYSVYGLTTYGSAAGFLSGGPFSGSESFTNKFVNGSPLFSFPHPFLNTGTVASQDVNGINPRLKIGYFQQWSFTVEQQVAGFDLGGSYVGANTRNLPYVRDLNQVRPSTNAFSSANRPFPNFFSIAYADNGGVDNYNSLQMFAKRPYGKNLVVNAGFTWAKDLTNVQDNSSFGGSQIQDAYNLNGDYGNSSAYLGKSFFAQVVYTLPAGKGQRFLGSAGTATDLVLGGWKMAWVVDKHSGFYFTPSVTGFDTSNTNSFSERPDVVPGVDPYAAHKNINGWLNPGAFKIPGCPDTTPLCSAPPNVGRFGNASVNSLVGPGFTDVDLSMYKEIRVAERITAKVNATATNVFNHPNFGVPAANIRSTGTYGVITSTAADLYGQQSRFLNFGFRLQF